MQYVDLGVLSQKKKERSRTKKIVKWSALVFLTTIVLYAGYVLYFPAAALLREILKNPSAALSLVKNPEGTLKSDNGRTNFLLLGIDKRDNVPYSYNLGNGEVKRNGFLSDTMLIISLDQNTKKVAMISIPRDTWVQLPSWEGHGSAYTKINASYSYGESLGYPGGGAAMAKTVISQSLGIPIHYVTRIDFAGFKKGIDSLGGVDVKVDKAFDDWSYPDSTKTASGYKHIHFNAGLQHMSGSRALEFVRSRKGTNGEGSDFARAKRQQKVILAARDKALSLFTIFDPLKINKLFSAFGETVSTDVDLAALPKLYKYSREINAATIKNLVLDTTNYMIHPPSSQYGGAYVVIPKGGSWTNIQQAVKNIFQEEAKATTEAGKKQKQ
ncbi:MAG: LCP family protein [bacterium]|nr:LCP family protein [bacterium]